MDSSVGWMDPEKFVDLFLAGRSEKTFPTYEMAFRKIWVHGAEIGKLPFWWSDMDFAGHLVLLNEIEASVNMFKQASAVLTLLKELVGLETVIGSSIVKTVKRGCIKSARDRVARKGKKERTVMTIDHVKLLIGRFYKKPAKKVCPKDRRFLLHQLLSFFGMRRFDDLKEIRVEDVAVLEDGDLEIFVARSKTDQDGLGFVFHVSGQKYKGFSMPEVFRWYVDSVGLSDGDYLFPRFGNAGGGKIIAQGKHFVGYSTVAAQLKNFCLRNDIPVLTLHSGRRGGVTLAVECGIDKMTIKKVGNWTSEAVDGYFMPKKAGVDFTSKALRKL